MELGTIVYENEIYNLDYMTASEISELLSLVDKHKNKENIILSAKLKSVYNDKISREWIHQKVNFQLNSMKTSMLHINAKFIEKSKNYDKIKEEMMTSLDCFEEVLRQLADGFDRKIQQLIYKQLELELKLWKIKAARKEELPPEDSDSSNVELKLKKEIKVVRKKLKSLEKHKESEIFAAMEVGNKAIGINVKKQRRLKNIPKFFSYKFNPYKVIQKNVIEPFEQRIDEFKLNKLKKLDGKSQEFNFSKVEEKINRIVEKMINTKEK